jgi:hypothetical protein
VKKKIKTKTTFTEEKNTYKINSFIKFYLALFLEKKKKFFFKFTAFYFFFILFKIKIIIIIIFRINNLFLDIYHLLLFTLQIISILKIKIFFK